MVLILLAMFFWEHGSIGAPSCQALFASYGGMLVCAHIIGRNPLRPSCVRVRMRAGACAHADGRTCASACVCACVRACGGCRAVAVSARQTHSLQVAPAG